MIWKRLSIRRKLFIAIAASLAVIICFVAAMTVISMRAGFAQFVVEAEIVRFQPLVERLADYYDRDTESWAALAGKRREFDTLVRQSAPRSDRPNADQFAPRAPRSPGQAPATGQLRPRPRSDPMQVRARMMLVDKDGNFIVGADISDQRTASRPVLVIDALGESEAVGALHLSLPEGVQSSADELFLSQQLQTLLFTAAMALVLAMIVALVLARQFVAPITRLVGGTQKLAEGAYETRLDSEREDEIGVLINQFNRLASTLEDAEIAQRQWISDTSHEFQTPLAVMRAEIEAVQDGVRAADEKTLTTLHHSVLRLSMLAKDINALSHASEGQLVNATACEDFGDLVHAQLEAMGQAFQNAGLKIETKIEPGVLVMCDPPRLEQLVDNLLSNSHRYTDEPGTVRVTVRKKRDVAILIVEDTAPAPPKEMLSRLFDRFFRAEASRARDTGGSGLGLSICQVIAVAHGGQITATQSELGGLSMTVELPLASIGNRP